MAQLERTYNVPLRKGFQNTPRHKRAKKAMTVLKEFLQKHMKADEVKIGQLLNKKIWENGIKNPPHHVEVKAVKRDDGVVEAELEGHTYTGTVSPEPLEEGGEGGLAERLGGAMGADAGKAEEVEEKLAEQTEEGLQEVESFEDEEGDETEGSEEVSEKEGEVPSESKVRGMTKDEIKEYASEEFGVELSTNDLKDEMIEQFFEEIK